MTPLISARTLKGRDKKERGNTIKLKPTILMKKHLRTKKKIIWEIVSCSTGLQQSNTGVCNKAICFVIVSFPLNFKCPSMCWRKAESIMCDI